jgi:hypothetical protein
MMGILMFAAAANAPLTIAGVDEAQWRLFVRASVQRQAPARASRMRQLQGTVRALGADPRAMEVGGPSGL